jgi:hypothetical protein
MTASKQAFLPHSNNLIPVNPKLGGGKTCLEIKKKIPKNPSSVVKDFWVSGLHPQ